MAQHQAYKTHYYDAMMKEQSEVQGNDNWVLWAVGGITVLSLGVVLFFVLKGGKSKKNNEFLSKIATTAGLQPIKKTWVWKSFNGTPRGEIIFYTDGKVTASGVGTDGKQFKLTEGNWSLESEKAVVKFKGGNNFEFNGANAQGIFWNMLKKATIFNEATNTFNPNWT